MRLDITNLAMPEPEAVTLLKAEVRRLRAALSSLADQGATLTDPEREAIASCIADDEAATAFTRADTLRSLLSRTGIITAKTGDDAAKCHSQSGNHPEREHLTDAEREAVERAADLIDAKTCGDSTTLRSLLERLGGER